MFMPPRYEFHRADPTDATIWRDAISGWMVNAENKEDAVAKYLDHVGKHRAKTVQKWTKTYPALEVSSVPVKRRLPQRPFKFKDYNSADDISRRLRRTMILIGSRLYYISDIHVGETDFLLIVHDAQGEPRHIWYSDPNVDLRAPDPRYLTINHMPYYVSRWPTRTQTQGVEGHNTYGKVAGATGFSTIPNFNTLLEAWEAQEDVVWDKSYRDLMTKLRAVSGLRLSSDIAVYHKPETQEVWAEYKGRSVGPVDGDVVLCDDLDGNCQWIYKDFRIVGLDMKVQP